MASVAACSLSEPCDPITNPNQQLHFALSCTFSDSTFLGFVNRTKWNNATIATSSLNNFTLLNNLNNNTASINSASQLNNDGLFNYTLMNNETGFSLSFDPQILLNFTIPNFFRLFGNNYFKQVAVSTASIAGLENITLPVDLGLISSFKSPSSFYSNNRPSELVIGGRAYFEAILSPNTFSNHNSSYPLSPYSFILWNQSMAYRNHIYLSSQHSSSLASSHVSKRDLNEVVKVKTDSNSFLIRFLDGRNQIVLTLLLFFG